MSDLSGETIATLMNFTSGSSVSAIKKGENHYAIITGGSPAENQQISNKHNTLQALMVENYTSQKSKLYDEIGKISRKLHIYLNFVISII